MAIYYTGVVSCTAQRSATVQLTGEERDELVAGRMPCPCCGTRCRPAFKLESASAGSSMSWRHGRWDAEPSVGER